MPFRDIYPNLGRWNNFRQKSWSSVKKDIFPRHPPCIKVVPAIANAQMLFHFYQFQQSFLWRKNPVQTGTVVRSQPPRLQQSLVVSDTEDPKRSTGEGQSSAGRRMPLLAFRGFCWPRLPRCWCWCWNWSWFFPVRRQFSDVSLLWALPLVTGKSNGLPSVSCRVFPSFMMILRTLRL